MALSIIWGGQPNDQLESANLDGTGQATITASGVGALSGLGIDSVRKKIWFTDKSADIIGNINFDGTGIATILDSSDAIVNPAHVTIDETNSKVYYNNREGATDGLFRANLDGTSIETLFAFASGGPQSLELDVVGNKLYSLAGFAQEIHRSDLDGSNDTTLYNAAGEGFVLLRDLALDIPNGHIYVTDQNRNGGEIMRGNIDGSGSMTVISSTLPNPHGIVLDLSGGRLYIVSSLQKKIASMDLNGSNHTTVLTFNDVLLISTIRLATLSAEAAGGRKTFWGPWYHLAGPGRAFGQSLPK